MTTHDAHFESYRLKLLPLCPVHVGSGTVVEPFEYDLELQEGNNSRLKIYDLDRLLASLDPHQQAAFERENDKGWHNVRTWLRNQYDDRSLRTSIVVKDGAARELHASLNDRGRTGEIHLLCRNPRDQQAIIPGSSVKGAIRTALLDAELAISSDHRKRKLAEIARRGEGGGSRVEQQFQATTLDYLNEGGTGPNLHRDPFRQVAISDFSVPEGMTHIDKIQIVSKRGIQESDPSGILIYRELTNAFLGYQSEDLAFSAELRLFPKLHHDPVMELKRLPIPIRWDQIRDACNEFYGPRFENEIQRHVEQEAIQNSLRDCLRALGPNDCLIRVGRHSHFECVTVDSPYHVPPRRGFGKSRTFVQGVCPLGWARLSVEPLVSHS